MVWFYQDCLTIYWRRENCLSIPLWSDFILSWVSERERNSKDFQSHYGLILSSWTAWKTFELGNLSIPLWSDFIQYFDAPLIDNFIVLSIPLWSDFIVISYRWCDMEKEPFNPTMVWFYQSVTYFGRRANIWTFNPTMVWFYLFGNLNLEQKSVYLSIPLWSDFIYSDLLQW